MTRPISYLWPGLLLILCGCTAALNQAQGQAQHPGYAGVDARSDSAVHARELGSSDPFVRQQGAEALARLAAVEQKKLVEGYHVQEKNKKVRLALDWALYRMGKSDALFQVVRELDTGRHQQAVRYLSQVDSPAVLYPFLKQEDTPAKITAGLLEALGQIGDGESLELIRPFRDYFFPNVASAAELAIDQIEKRLATQVESSAPARPRTVGTAQKTSP